MKIVVLDGYTLNPGDLSWERLEALGSLTVYDRTPYESDTIVEAIGNATIVFTNKTPLPKEVLEKVPAVKYIGVLATGFNIVAIDAAKSLGIIVTNVPTYGTKGVAQMTMALLLEMCHHVGEHNRAVKNGQWTNSKDFCFWNYPLMALEGKTMGIIGYGSIGRDTAKLAEAFGMKILTSGSRKRPKIETENIKQVEMDELFKGSDVISLHCPLTPETEGIINTANISKMKDGVMLVNTSRGQLIVEKDLKTALDSGKIAFAAVDVASQEPIRPDNPLLHSENCIITPHIAWAPIDSRINLMNTAVENLEAFLKGSPQNVVN